MAEINEMLVERERQKLIAAGYDAAGKSGEELYALCDLHRADKELAFWKAWNTAKVSPTLKIRVPAEFVSRG